MIVFMSCNTVGSRVQRRDPYEIISLWQSDMDNSAHNLSAWKTWKHMIPKIPWNVISMRTEENGFPLNCSLQTNERSLPSWPVEYNATKMIEIVRSLNDIELGTLVPATQFWILTNHLETALTTQLHHPSCIIYFLKKQLISSSYAAQKIKLKTLINRKKKINLAKNVTEGCFFFTTYCQMISIKLIHIADSNMYGSPRTQGEKTPQSGGGIT